VTRRHIVDIDNLLTSLTEEDLIKIANKIGPYVIDATIQTPRIMGDRARLFCSKKVKIQNTFFNLNSGTVTIGDGTFFGSYASVLTGTHNIELKGAARKKAPTKGSDIVIGSGVWIASHAIIIGPCTIGDNAVIAAGSVVTPGVYEAGCMYAGVPAKLKYKIEFKEGQ
jgi:acetyltransferase-like isoleucine patch superfamily enzyme